MVVGRGARTKRQQTAADGEGKWPHVQQDGGPTSPQTLGRFNLHFVGEKKSRGAKKQARQPFETGSKYSDIQRVFQWG